MRKGNWCQLGCANRIPPWIYCPFVCTGPTSSRSLWTHCIMPQNSVWTSQLSSKFHVVSGLMWIWKKRMVCFRLPGQHQLVSQRFPVHHTFTAVQRCSLLQRLDCHGIPVHLSDHIHRHNLVQVVRERRAAGWDEQVLRVLLWSCWWLRCEVWSFVHGSG